MKESPFVFVKVVEEINDLRIFETTVAKPLPDVSPVFTFDVSVIVFLVFSGSSELDGIISFAEIIK